MEKSSLQMLSHPHFIHGLYELSKYAYEYQQFLSLIQISHVLIIQNLQGIARRF